MNWRKVYPNVAPPVEDEPQNEEIYLSSEDEDEITEDSDIDEGMENECINEHVVRNETSENENTRPHEEDESEDASSEDTSPDSKDGAMQGFLQKEDIERELRPGQTKCIVKTGG